MPSLKMEIGRSKSKRAKNIFSKKELEILSFIPSAKRLQRQKREKMASLGKRQKRPTPLSQKYKNLKLLCQVKILYKKIFTDRLENFRTCKEASMLP